MDACSKTANTHTHIHINIHILTYVHAKINPVVYIISPDRRRQRVEEDRKHSS